MIELDKRNIFCLKDFKENIQKCTPSTSEKRQQIKKNEIFGLSHCLKENWYFGH